FSASLFASGRRIYEKWIAELLSGDAPGGHVAATLRSLAISEHSRARLLSQLTRATRVGQEARTARLRSVATKTLAILERAEAGGSPADAPKVPDQDAASGLQRALGLSSERFDRVAIESAAEVLDAHRRALDNRSGVVEYILG